MQFKPETENVVMISSPCPSASPPFRLDKDQQLQRTRKIFIIILGVLVTLSATSLASSIFGLGSIAQTNDALLYAVNGEIVISILFYLFGIFVAHQYHETGLRIFAWLSVIELVIMSILIGFLFFSTIITMIAAFGLDQEIGIVIVTGASVLLFIIILICIGSFILTLILVKLAFKMARLIDVNKSLITQQI